MSDPQKTHQPTPKRLKESRKKGEIALSRDVVSAAAFAGGGIAMLACGASAFGALKTLTRDVALAADGAPHNELAGEAIHVFATAAAPVVIGGAVGALLSIFGQLGWPPAFKSIGLDFTKLNPAANLMRTFSLGEMGKRTGSALLKMSAVGGVVTIALHTALNARPGSAQALTDSVGTIVTRVLQLVIGSLVGIAAIDYILARKKHMEGLMMSPDEVKREHRESDGDPHVKGKRRSKMKELARRRLASAVATASVIVVNPTHYAVALRYDETKDAAPIVVAKGIDEVAEKIRELAREHGIPVLPRPPLARALHKLVKEGRPVPAKLYRAVAEVLAFVYRIRNGGAA